jgi:hypothetical protein
MSILNEMPTASQLISNNTLMDNTVSENLSKHSDTETTRKHNFPVMPTSSLIFKETRKARGASVFISNSNKAILNDNYDPPFYMKKVYFHEPMAQMDQYI